ncbi:Protein of unknown function [Nitrosomonas aestuarii]|uniref:Methylase n=1 Tax=Nitrosomonas aestuarii TaxID=52441 RepID=A0A1I4DP14_9PROT|nr:DUF938 domain-containing protein [Nitrosomonas aestuarii]SFK95065.1 Protein of unknown function [Nitrosomonas aestuarii]
MQAVFSESAERNKHPILEKLHPLLVTRKSVLEIGSGTGQHAVFFAAALPHLQWHPTELLEKLPLLSNHCSGHPLDNLAPPIALDIDAAKWPTVQVDAVFTANTLHIISWPQVCRFFTQVGKLLPEHGICCIYGPFNIDGRYTSESNAQFDHWLKNRNPESGIRDITNLQQHARICSLSLQENYAMPANNRLLIWGKCTSVA